VKTPRDIVAKLHDETQKAVQLPAIQERLAKLGVDPLIMTPAEFELYFKEDVAATVKLAEAAGIQKQ
jgi:tripartite-type tricarboxylate transporter receptor subunit TctC